MFTNSKHHVSCYKHNSDNAESAEKMNPISVNTLLINIHILDSQNLTDPNVWISTFSFCLPYYYKSFINLGSMCGHQIAGISRKTTLAFGAPVMIGSVQWNESSFSSFLLSRPAQIHLLTLHIRSLFIRCCWLCKRRSCLSISCFCWCSCFCCCCFCCCFIFIELSSYPSLALN